jgi:hypothetical protein
MKVRFKFLIDDVNWADHGGIWISQGFRRISGEHYYLVRGLINWDSIDIPMGKKYNCDLVAIAPDEGLIDTQSVLSCARCDRAWEELSPEEKVKALYQYGVGESLWNDNGNNYSKLFQKCQEIANKHIAGDEPICKRAIAQALRDGKLKLAPAPDAAVLGGVDRLPEPGSVVLGGRN